MSKAIFFFLSLLLLTAPVARAEDKFHAPQTEPEKVLDKILRMNDDEKKWDVYGFVFNYPDRRKQQEKELAPLFTKGFLDRSEKEEKQLITESCGGTYPKDGIACDMFRSINPISCAQDTPDTYLYRTTFAGKNTAYVSYTWDGKGDGTTYRLLKQGTQWKLDENSCGSGDKSGFEMHSK